MPTRKKASAPAPSTKAEPISFYGSSAPRPSLVKDANDAFKRTRNTELANAPLVDWASKASIKDGGGRFDRGPKPPRKPLSAFALLVAEHKTKLLQDANQRAAWRDKMPAAVALTEATRTARKAWKALTDAQRTQLQRRVDEDKARYQRELEAFRAAHPHLVVASPKAKTPYKGAAKGKKTAGKSAGKSAGKGKSAGPKRKTQKKQDEDEEVAWDSDASDELVEQALAELADWSEDEEDEGEAAPPGRATKTPGGGAKSSDKGTTTKTASKSATKTASKSAMKTASTSKTKTPLPQLTSPTGKQRSTSSAGKRSMAVAAAAVTGAARTQKRKASSVNKAPESEYTGAYELPVSPPKRKRRT